jgi:hypothetical protein
MLTVRPVAKPLPVMRIVVLALAPTLAGCRLAMVARDSAWAPCAAAGIALTARTVPRSRAVAEVGFTSSRYVGGHVESRPRVKE